MRRPLLLGLIVALIGSTTVPATLQAAEPAPARGKALFDLWCGACHKPTGEFVSSVPGTTALQNKYQGRVPAALEQRTDLNAPYVKTIVRTGVLSMPFFRKTELSDADLDALAAYLAKR